MTKSVHAICAVLVICIGMAGLYFKIEYSGWVLFTGRLWAVCA